ncbi:hypothetical protein KIN20_022797 [Parelaphostrongylus tenuis]|uniref:Uncharacterized protein n=1 Tax=Parelaphostrongylus tenuis TaxID=148309 RepID=A0AAD5QVL8_PARTN|nr:hypothetical protein KIN20_022797 [Parelaphostrongylus tenuis]
MVNSFRESLILDYEVLLNLRYPIHQRLSIRPSLILRRLGFQLITSQRVFIEGQSYVAMCRARSLAAVRVIAFDPSVTRANPNVVRRH